MTIYAFPNITPTTQTFELVTNTKTFQSPLSNSVQTLSRKGSHWKTSMTFNNLSGTDRAVLQAFIANLNGQQDRFYARDFGAVRSGNAPASDSPTIYDMRILGFPDIAQTNRVVLNNVTSGITNYFRAGDYIVFNNELHIITQDADSGTGSAAGRVAAYIAPNLRKQPTVGQSANFVAPNTVFMMTNNPQWRTQAPYFSSITIEAIEDVLA